MPQREPGARRLAVMVGVLVALASAAAVLGQPVGEIEKDFQDVKLCGACHQQQYKDWTGSMHAQSHTDPLYDRYFIKASQQTDGAIEPFCAGCHTPVAVLHGAIPFPEPPQGPEDTRVDPIEEAGVSCEYCHRIESYAEPHNGKAVIRGDGTMLGPYGDSESTFHETAYSELQRTPEFCGGCHTVDHPTNGIHLELTYEEWKASDWAAQAVICQDCHMGSQLGAHVDTPGVAGLGGPERPHVANHNFVGPTLAFSQNDEDRAASEALLRAAAEVAIGDPRTEDGATVIPVLVTNKAAGHSIPTGITELREVWLEVVATDANGAEVFHSGALDDAGEIAEGSVVYTTVVHDETGSKTTLFWNTVEKFSDYRIPPNSTLTEEFRLPDGVSAASVTAKLHYRSVAPFGMAEASVPDGEFTIPVFTMAEAERAL